MSQTQHIDSKADALVAPGEIRELLGRLTEQTVEAIPANESRTLEGLAAETGIPVATLRETLADIRGKKSLSIPPVAWIAFIGLAILATWLVRTPLPDTVQMAPVVAAPVVEPKGDLTGLVPLTAVTFGPDGGNTLVDNTFQPSQPLPEGISIYAMVGEVMWGTGDHRAKAIDHPLSESDEKIVRAAIGELLRYVQKDAERRQLPTGLSGTASKYPKGSHQVSLGVSMYSGGGGYSVVLPPTGADDAGATRNAIDLTTSKLIEQVQSSLRQQRDWHRDNGP